MDRGEMQICGLGKARISWNPLHPNLDPAGFCDPHLDYPWCMNSSIHLFTYMQIHAHYFVYFNFELHYWIVMAKHWLRRKQNCIQVCERHFCQIIYSHNILLLEEIRIDDPHQIGIGFCNPIFVTPASKYWPPLTYKDVYSHMFLLFDIIIVFIACMTYIAISLLTWPVSPYHFLHWININM